MKVTQLKRNEPPVLVWADLGYFQANCWGFACPSGFPVRAVGGLPGRADFFRADLFSGKPSSICLSERVERLPVQAEFDGVWANCRGLVYPRGSLFRAVLPVTQEVVARAQGGMVRNWQKKCAELTY